MLKRKIILPSTSRLASPCVIVKKKDGTDSFWVDYRKLNAITMRDKYPLPRVDDILDALGQVKLFSSLDQTSGYRRIQVAEDDGLHELI